MTIQLSDLIYRKKNLLTAEQCQFLIDEYEKINNKFQESTVNAITGNKTTSTYKRGVLTDGSEAQSLLYTATNTIIREYLDYLDSFDSFNIWIRSSMLYSHMFRLLKYDTGNSIPPHTDQSPFINGSCSIALNNNYTGGDFVFWNGRHRIQLDAGEGLIFPAGYIWVHEVEEIKSGARYSYNSFLTNIKPEYKQYVETMMQTDMASERYKLTGMPQYNVKKNN
jgi:hypothetical protein